MAVDRHKFCFGLAVTKASHTERKESVCTKAVGAITNKGRMIEIIDLFNSYEDNAENENAAEVIEPHQGAPRIRHAHGGVDNRATNASQQANVEIISLLDSDDDSVHNDNVAEVNDAEQPHIQDERCPICTEAMTGEYAIVEHTQCGNRICMTCYQNINGMEPEEERLDAPIIPSSGCPMCRSHLQWIDVGSGQEVAQLYGFRRTWRESGQAILTRIFSVNDWNALCFEFNLPDLRITYNNAAVLNLDQN
jgi:hypothetical protein